MFDLSTGLGLGFLDLAPRFVEYTALIQLFVGAAPRRNLPSEFATSFTPLCAGIPALELMGKFSNLEMTLSKALHISKPWLSHGSTRVVER